jgi:tetratricopeptide (TPR) repeat protein
MTTQRHPAVIKGIFSTTNPPKVGAFRSRKPAGPSYWFAKEAPDGSVAAQQIDEATFTTRGRLIFLPKEEFFERFVLEPELWYRHVSQRVMRGDAFREAGENIEAKIEYTKALGVDEENIRGLFGLSLAYLELNEEANARHAFDRLVVLDEAFAAEHKHLFNEFGIALRKKKLPDLALRFYERAGELAEDDENLLLNMARASLDMGDTGRATQLVRRALDLNPEHAEAKAFKGYLLTAALHPQKNSG